jgi:predicted metalloprotease with PDZ domain
MGTRRLRVACALLVLVGLAAPASAQPVEYRLTFTNHVQHLMDVEVTFSGVTADPLEIRMSRTSPGRYALHEFAKNVFEVRAEDGSGQPIALEQPNLHQWNARRHGGTVKLRYRLFGNRVDGTYAGIDADHAHLNIPATLMWARTLESRPVRVTLVPPPDVAWKPATQLFPTGDPFVFTAPNLAYLLDSPIQFSPHVLESFQVANGSRGPVTIRVALHHAGTDEEAKAFVRDVERIVREQQAVFGELPAFEPGHYTFLATYRPGTSGDGMEHRNSTVVTSAASLRTSRAGLLGTVSHEFFHAWNVERIRPRSLEPFDFEDANMSGELWLAEGFTSYYGPLTLIRAGLTPLDQAVRGLEGTINAVVLTPGRRFRSAVDMSRLAPFVDAAVSVDPTNWENTFLSYYTYGAALGLGLDLTLRDRSDGRVSLDDFMRALWRTYGRTPGAPGLVATPYTMADLERTLGEVSGDAAFAKDFFARYIAGHDVVDYGRLLARAGLVLRQARPADAWMGDLPLAFGADGATFQGPPQMGTPAFEAGLGTGDVLVAIGGTPVRSDADLATVLGAARPGDTLQATIRRHGRERQVTIALRASPRLDLATVESTGAALSADQKAFREAWLGSRVR